MWKQQLLEFSKQFKHPAWGINHYKRVYELSMELAKQQAIKIDEDVLFAASMLHDIGAFEKYAKKGVEHDVRSVEVVEEVVIPMGFPKEKIELLKDTMSTHMFYEEPSFQEEPKVFHDADTLDFMGYIGVTRLLSIVGLDDWTPDLKTAIELIAQFSDELYDRLITPLAKEIWKERQKEMKKFLSMLEKETKELELL
jgi:uncharacterized protein